MHTIFDYHHHPHKHHNHEHHLVHEEKLEKQKSNLKIPVTIVGGFLGAGKTSVVNHIIANTSHRVDVLIREFGSVSVDDMLIHLNKKNIHVFPGVSLHHDPQLMLYGYLNDLYEKTEGTTFDNLIMELSGLDSPEQLVQLFFLGDMPKQYRLASFITIVDAEYGQLNLDDYPISISQIAYADVILINKIDLVTKESLKSLAQRVHNINSVAKIFFTKYGETNLDEIMDLDFHKQLFDCTASFQKGGNEMSMDNIKTIVLSESKPLDKEKVNEWIQNLFITEGIKILRSKGFLNFSNSDYRYEFQAVRKTFHSKADRLWDNGEERKSVVVLIGEGLDDEEKYQEAFRKCIVNDESQI
ncbi:MAG: cobalamin synthesis protein [Clostridia bacterium]|nr:cobalamin synthesis protein [Clostridia bacterium]